MKLHSHSYTNRYRQIGIAYLSDNFVAKLHRGITRELKKIRHNTKADDSSTDHLHDILVDNKSSFHVKSVLTEGSE